MADTPSDKPTPKPGDKPTDKATDKPTRLATTGTLDVFVVGDIHVTRAGTDLTTEQANKVTAAADAAGVTLVSPTP